MRKEITKEQLNKILQKMFDIVGAGDIKDFDFLEED